jgi:hypothetical protein
MYTHEPSLAGDRRSALTQQRYTSGTNTTSSSSHCSTELDYWPSHSQSTKISKDSNATPNLVGVHESGPRPAVRYVYHPIRPSLQPSTHFTSPGGMSKECSYPRATSAGSFTHVVLKDMENQKSHVGFKGMEKEKSQSPLPPSPHPTTAGSMILVSPGHEAKLRGAAETWQAIQHDSYLACVCFDCQAPLFCILDAWLVICPHCRVLSPIYHTNGDVAMNQEGGVGLGFTIETLMEALATGSM